MMLEYQDIEPFLFRIKQELKRELLQELERDDVFLRYPRQLAEHLNVSDRTARRLWNKPGFPQRDLGGIRGVYVSELKRWEEC